MLELRKRKRGLFVKLPSTQAIDIVAGSGLDFAVVDLEHSQLTEAHALGLVAHARALGHPALVRIPELDRGAVNRLLEAGAAGIQLSTVRRASQVRELVAATRYAPDGDRSISLAHAAAGYGAMGLAEYTEAARVRRPLVVAQLETADTDDPLRAIFAAGPDVAFVGTTDLAVDVGLDHDRLDARIREIADAAVAAGVVLGGFGLDDPRVRYDLVSSDLALLRGAVTDAA